MKSLYVTAATLPPGTGDVSVAVEFRRVGKVFGQQPVLRDINFQVNAGEVVAICGPSGSGKSTMIRLINQLETLNSGQILFTSAPPPDCEADNCGCCVPTSVSSSSSLISIPILLRWIMSRWPLSKFRS